MRTLCLLRHAFRRMLSQLGLTLLSLVGVSLSIGMVTSIPIFSHAVSFLVMREELQQLADTVQRPPFALRCYYVSTKTRALDYGMALGMESVVTQVVSERLQLPIKLLVTEVDSPRIVVRPAQGDMRFGGRDDVNLRQVNLSVLSDVAEHMEIVDGAAFGAAPITDRVPVWAHEKLAEEMGVYAGDKFDLLHPRSGEIIAVYIAGVWQAKERRDPYWFYEPASTYQNMFFVTREVYEQRVQPLYEEKTGFVSWYVVVDETAMALEKGDLYFQGLKGVGAALASHLPNTMMDYTPEEPMQRYLQRKATLSVILVGFSLPAMGLLFYFLSLISTVTVLFQRQETAILTSRGSGRSTIVWLALGETMLLVGLGTPLGVGTGYALARLMGYSLSFLTFVSRPPIPASPWAFDWRLLAAALSVLLVARFVPTVRAARESIVTHGQQHARAPVASIAGRLAIDVPLAAASWYAYRQLSLRGTLGVIGWEPSGDPFRDPLILLAPSLFIFTAALFLGHLFPLLVRPLDLIGRWIGSLSGSMGLRQLVRQGGYYANNLFLVIVCLSLGAFYASMAQSLDRWLRDRIRYGVGAQFTIEQGAPPTYGESGMPVGKSASGGWLLPVGDYLHVPGVVDATRVGDYQAMPTPARSVRKARLLGVDRTDFARVAYFRPDFSRVPLGELMNRLGMYPTGVLVSSKYLAANQLTEGQQIALEVRLGDEEQRIEFLIVGTYDYFPTMYPQKDDLFVCNLDYLFEQVGGVYPHHVWMVLDPHADREAVLKDIDAMGVQVVAVNDASLLISKDEDRVERVGLFGLLTIGFLAGSTLSVMGLLVYTYASLQGRLHQFSILRAMGATVPQVLGIAGVEYAGVILYGVLGGAAVGVTASRLFVPFFQYTSDATLAVPPFAPEIAWAKIAWIAVAFAGALVLAQLVILYGVTKRDVFQMLRMGQRE